MSEWCSCPECVPDTEPPSYNFEDVKALAHKTDPECWESYSGKDRRFKQRTEARRSESLKTANWKLLNGEQI